MAQPAPVEANGTSGLTGADQNGSAVHGKRKRDDHDDDEDMKMNGVDEEMKGESQTKAKSFIRNQDSLIKSYYEVLQSYDVAQPILKRRLSEDESQSEPDAKRLKPSDSSPPRSIAEKVAAQAYSDLGEIRADLALAVNAHLEDMDQAETEESVSETSKRRAQICRFRDQTLELATREMSYGQEKRESLEAVAKEEEEKEGKLVLSLVGYAPQERRLFSSLPISSDASWADCQLPAGMTVTRLKASSPKAERVPSLGELFAPAGPQPPLQAPKLPKSQAKGNKLDFYHPELAERAQYAANNYFNTRLSAGHFLDYSRASPSVRHRNKQHERVQSLAGKGPSEDETQANELEALFRGAFSSFAPCKDDSAALVPSAVAGRMWWQRAGMRGFQRMIEVEYYDGAEESDGLNKDSLSGIDDAVIQEAIKTWDELVVDPSLEEAMGTKRADDDKDLDEILSEVTDLIETLASYQRIRNLNLPNSHNRPGSEPVSGDMLATAAPKPSEEELVTYQTLKAQLALIIKTLPPYAVAKLNGDQLDELLISTKIPVPTPQYHGLLEEDESAVQARIRAQQQVAQASPRQQRTPSVSAAAHPHQYQQQPQQQNQYSTPTRTPSYSQQQQQQQQQQFYRAAPTPGFQQTRNFSTPTVQQARPAPQATPYSRPNGYQNQYATQLAKAQTPYGHQQMPQFAGQQRASYGQTPQGNPPSSRYPSYNPNFPPQKGTPNQSYSNYNNGAAMPPRQMSPHVNAQQAYSSAPYSTPQQQQQQQQQQAGRYNAATTNSNGQNQMQSQMSRFQAHPQPHQQSPQPQTSSRQSPGLVGYHTVISEAQQQRILEQAKARVAAQERTASFGDKTSYTGASLGPPHLGGHQAGNRSYSVGGTPQQQPQQLSQPNARTPTPGSATDSQQFQRPASIGTPGPPSRVTPVPLPQVPGQQQR